MNHTRPHEIWITHSSVGSWADSNLWDDYFREVESLLEDRLVKLDANDPARRTADTSRGEGQFVTRFGRNEDSRWLLGRFGKTKVSLVLNHYKDGKDSWGNRRENTIKFQIPLNAQKSIGLENIANLFRLSNARLGVFYASAEWKRVYCDKKASPPSVGALDISSELNGVFWLTYFGPHYCQYFGWDVLEKLEGASRGPAKGMTLKLAESPDQVPANLRESVEKVLGENAFAGKGATTINKPEGKYALTLDQLASLPV